MTYWIYQAAGWLAYSAVGITINLLSGASARTLILSHVVFIAVSIGLTDGLRRVIRQRRERYRSAKAMWPLLVAGVFAISVVQESVIIGADVVLSPGRGNGWTVTSVMALWWGMALATGVWVMLYLRITEKRRDEARGGQLTLAVREAELRALEAQINPHFLFNCLNSIRALVVIDPPRAQDMVTRLANVLRHSLRHESGHTVLLESEMDAVADYLALEAVRFEERLRVEVAVDPAVKEWAVPAMLLQTLVENAIKHGIGQVTGRGELVVRAQREDGYLRLVVENSGKLGEAAAGAASGSGKLGLANVRERLRLLYGDRATLRLEDGGGRVTATVLIPAI